MHLLFALYDDLCMRIAWGLPKRVVGWAVARAVANATQGRYSDEIVPEIAAMTVLKRWYL
jgi:hypothetical protein